jgi:hypothetical protein
MPYTEESWEQQNLKKKEPKPITNAFAYNPKRVVKESNFQTGITKNNLRDNKIKALASGKRISKTGKIYYEYRANRTDIGGMLK